MIGKIIGALVGRELDRRQGSDGVKGAVAGAVAAGVLRRMGPLGMLIGSGYVAKKAYERRKMAKRSVI